MARPGASPMENCSRELIALIDEALKAPGEPTRNDLNALLSRMEASIGRFFTYKSKEDHLEGFNLLLAVLRRRDFSMSPNEAWSFLSMPDDRAALEAFKYELEGVKFFDRIIVDCSAGNQENLAGFLKQYAMYKDKAGGVTGHSILYAASLFKAPDSVPAPNKIGFVRYLVEVAGCDVNVKNLDGSTPLMAAATVANQPVFQYLLSKKADPSIPNKAGQTALSLQGNKAQVISKNHIWEILSKSAAQDYNLAKGARWGDAEGWGSILDDDLQKKNIISILNLPDSEGSGYFEINLGEFTQGPLKMEGGMTYGGASAHIRCRGFPSFIKSAERGFDGAFALIDWYRQLPSGEWLKCDDALVLEILQAFKSERVSFTFTPSQSTKPLEFDLSSLTWNESGNTVFKGSLRWIPKPTYFDASNRSAAALSSSSSSIDIDPKITKDEFTEDFDVTTNGLYQLRPEVIPDYLNDLSKDTFSKAAPQPTVILQDPTVVPKPIPALAPPISMVFPDAAVKASIIQSLEIQGERPFVSVNNKDLVVFASPDMMGFITNVLESTDALIEAKVQEKIEAINREHQDRANQAPRITKVFPDSALKAQMIQRLEIKGERASVSVKNKDLVVEASEAMIDFVTAVITETDDMIASKVNEKISKIEAEKEARERRVPPMKFIVPKRFSIWDALLVRTNEVKTEVRGRGDTGTFTGVGFEFLKDADKTPVLAVENGTPEQVATAKRLSETWRQIEDSVDRREVSAVGKIKKQIADIEFNAMQVKCAVAKRESYFKFCNALHSILNDELLKIVQKRMEIAKQQVVNYIKIASFKVAEASMINTSTPAKVPVIKTSSAILTALEKVVDEMKASQQKKLDDEKTRPTREAYTVRDALIARILSPVRDSVVDLLAAKQNFLAPIPDILFQVSIILRAFKDNRPIFEHSTTLIDLIAKNHVVSLHTTTGTGKSTVLPALLLSAGYKKIAVTQPRRLPCTLIANHVAKIFGEGVTGWEVSGAMDHPHNPIVYLTDGLLKERLIFDPDLKRYNYDVIVLDEIHERGINIDLCVAALARYFDKHPDSKLKVILSSATLDPAVEQPFKRLPPINGVPRVRIQEFNIHVPAPCKVDTVHVPGVHPLALANELRRKLVGNEQILVFMASVKDVNEAVTMFTSAEIGADNAHALYAGQSASAQEHALKNGRVFFSTTIAETSLTFPNLKYVIDTGRINVPRFDSVENVFKLEEIDAPKSTALQRKGRLGRLQSGTYYVLYRDDNTAEYPKPQIGTIELADVEFGLIRSQYNQTKSALGLEALLPYLPTKVDTRALANARKTLEKIGFLDANGAVTQLGEWMCLLPIVGGARMTRAVLEGVAKQHCGRNMLRLAATIMQLPNNPAPVIKAIPTSYHSQWGDIASLMNLVDEMCRLWEQSKGRISSTEVQNRLKLTSVKSTDRDGALLISIMKKLAELEVGIGKIQDFRARSHVSKTEWEPVAKSLMAGFGDMIFARSSDFNGAKRIYFNLAVDQNGKRGEVRKRRGNLMFGSLVAPTNDKPGPELVITLSFMYGTQDTRVGMTGMVGVIEPSWATWKIDRSLAINQAEREILQRLLGGIQKAFHPATITLEDPVPKSETSIVRFCGTTGDVFRACKHVSEKIRDYDLFNATLFAGVKTEGFDKRLETVFKFTKVFDSLIWRWSNTRQVKVEVSVTDYEFEMTGRRKYIDKVILELRWFQHWLNLCTVVRQAHSGVPPRNLNDGSLDREITKNVMLITNPERSRISLLEAAIGPHATRETRMELVAWVCCCLFDCHVEGGFIRDWVIRRDSKRPQSAQPWLKFDTEGRPELDPDLLPPDLDVQLPYHREFEIQRLVDELRKRHIEVARPIRDSWRWLLVIDSKAPTGPFCVDLIEPHIVVTHDMIDFDVNNLYVEKGRSGIGLRVDITKHAELSLDLDKIVKNAKAKELYVLRSEDKFMQPRVKKMQERRGWRILGRYNWSPDLGPKFGAILHLLHKSSPAYSLYGELIEKEFKGTVISIQQVQSHNLRMIYDAMKSQIKRENGGDANEKELFHGTTEDAAEGITNTGFDDRFFNNKFSTTRWGSGSYFANDIRKSHGYTNPTTPTNGTHVRVMFICKVTLGKQYNTKKEMPELRSAPKGFHSVHAELGSTPSPNDFEEFIVYRYGQALPYLIIKYTAPK